MHEAQMHESNCFLTLTYNDENLPADHGLNVRDWQLFAKRLRKRGYRFRFYHVGEYGDIYARPHYHAAIFGQDFSSDRTLRQVDENGYSVYVSPLLEKVWDKGYHLIGELTFDSAMYVARYVTKKITGKGLDAYQPGGSPYQRIDVETGEVWEVAPEYATMSRGGRGSDGIQLGGIGSKFFEKYMDEIYVTDSVVLKGREFRPPQYYDRKLEEKDNVSRERIRAERRKSIRSGGTDFERRARSREMVLLAQQGQKAGKLS